MAELADHPSRSFADVVGSSVGEQVLLLAIGGELDTAFVLPGIFSDDNPAPSASADAWHVVFLMVRSLSTSPRPVR